MKIVEDRTCWHLALLAKTCTTPIHTNKTRQTLQNPLVTVFLGYNARVFPKVMFTYLYVFSLKHIINSFSSYQNDRCITLNGIQRDCDSFYFPEC